jgi:hypothetical protein
VNWLRHIANLNQASHGLRMSNMPFHAHGAEVTDDLAPVQIAGPAVETS